MASNGFFLGGLADGAMAAQKQGLAERTQDDDVGLRTRGLDLQERQVGRTEQNDLITRGDALIANNMAAIAETIKAGLAGGADPAKLRATITPLVRDAQNLAKTVGRDPNSIAAQAEALLNNPDPVATARVTGTAAGTQTGTTQTTAAGIINPTGDNGSTIIDPSKRADEEGRLRDDYDKRSKDFYTLRDFKDRIDSAPSTGPGDIQLVFSYMKVLDPASTVREGEFATASNSGGVPSSVMSLYNKLVGGGRLEKDVRGQIRDSATAIWTKAAGRQSDLTNEFVRAARSKGVNPRNVIMEPPAAPRSGTTPGGTTFKVIP